MISMTWWELATICACSVIAVAGLAVAVHGVKRWVVTVDDAVIATRVYRGTLDAHSERLAFVNRRVDALETRVQHAVDLLQRPQP